MQAQKAKKNLFIPSPYGIGNRPHLHNTKKTEPIARPYSETTFEVSGGGRFGFKRYEGKE